MLTTTIKFTGATLVHRLQHEDAEPDDLQLLMRVQKSDRRALELLYDRYSAKALGLCCKILRDRDLAEGVVVDAFWHVWERAEQFEMGRGSFTSWFYGIVRHLAIDELRRRDARPVPSEDEELELAFVADVTRENDVTEIVGRRLTADTVQSALDALPPAQRQVIELAYVEGLTRKEISKQLGQPIGTIHTRARLGLDKLRVLLEPVSVGR